MQPAFRPEDSLLFLVFTSCIGGFRVKDFLNYSLKSLYMCLCHMVFSSAWYLKSS